MSGKSLIIEYFNTFQALQNNFNKGISNKVFGELSNHLFQKWLKCDRNILNFISMLDPIHKKKLLKWAYKYYGPESSHNSFE